MQICESCGSGCCRKYAIALTGYDILNISKTLSIDPSSFIQLSPVEGVENIEYQSKYTALFKFTDENSDIFYRFNLKMNESQLVPGTLKCQFLMEWHNDTLNPSVEGIVAKCGIYSCRPFVCTAYPATFDVTEKRGIVKNIKNESSEHPIYNLCPRKITDKDLSGSSDHIMQALIMRKYELEYFKNLAEYWNQNPGSTENFLNFIRKVYDSRVLVKD